MPLLTRRRLRWVLVVFGAIALLAGVVLALGLATPRTHRAAVRATYAANQDAVFAAILDVAGGAEWRTGVKQVDLLSDPAQPASWREHSDWGTLTFVHEAVDPPHRIVSRIVDEDQGFGGTWTYQLQRTREGTELILTEDGVVDNPLYRFMSRFVMDHHEGIETYARDLGRKLGEEVEPERIR